LYKRERIVFKVFWLERPVPMEQVFFHAPYFRASIPP
jgi:hypothetical protein